jgi:hypothetical protein
MTVLDRRYRWLLRAYPAWYRREWSGEVLGLLLEASPPGSERPTFRDARSIVTAGLRVRGWIWLLSMLWVGAGAGYASYSFYLTTKPWTGYQAAVLPTSSAPLLIAFALVVVALFASLISVPVAGFVRLRGWRRDRWLRATAWAVAWIASVGLYVLSNQWAEYPEQKCPHAYQIPGMVCPIPSPAVVSWGELPICAAFLMLAGMMTWILAVPPVRRSDLCPALTPMPAARLARHP